jgi:hypothetical protein
LGHYLALVDTGADTTILPRSIADDLGIALSTGAVPHLTSFGGHQMEVSLGEVQLKIEDGTNTVRWTTRVHFFEFGSTDQETIVLGHTGFLEYFTATFDGANQMLTLQPNNKIAKD